MNGSQDLTPRVNEQLSAWLDDELPAAEVELLATRLSQSPEQQARAARYALIGSHLRAGRTSDLAAGLLALGLRDRVRAVVEVAPEPAIAADRQVSNRWLPYAAAAGIAMLAVALIPMLRMSSEVPPVDQPIAASAMLSVAVTPASLSSDRMTSYLVYHGEYSGMLSAKFTDSSIINARSAAVPASGSLPAR